MLIRALNPKIDLIRYDRTRGASELALLALDMLAEHSLTCICTSPINLMDETLLLAGELSTARPSMAPIANALHMFNEEIAPLQPLSVDLETLRDALESCAILVRQNMQDRRCRAIKHAVQHIESGQCIASCSYSSMVVETLIQASQEGKKIRSIWPESRFNGHSYGTFSQNRLDEHGIACQLVEDHEIDKAVQSSDLVLLGADTLMPSGDFLNGCPSKAIAKATRRSRGPLPLYCLADSTKILWDAELAEIEPGLEMVPHEWLEGIFTENGLLLPRQLKPLHLR